MKFQRGFSMLEVLITLVILSFGLLSLAGLQARLQLSEVESYQRAQALILVQDMANRIASNRNNAASYVTGTTYVGAGSTCATSTATQKDRDLGEWCNSLQGAAETLSSSKVGALIGGRGCIENIGANLYMVSVVWQGTSSVSAPTGTQCGQNLYNSGTQCTSDSCRRSISTVVRIGTLT